MGYKSYELASHKTLIHSGRYFYGGFSYEFGNTFLNKIQFQVSNSNQETELDIIYISASTAGNIYYDFVIKSISLKKINYYFGLHAGNDFTLNFFPKIDNKNLLWFNQSFLGVSLISKYKIGSNNRIDFNAHVPFLASVSYNRFDRLNSKVPNNKSVRSYSGSISKLFNANSEAGYVFSLGGFEWGIYYQLEINRMNESASNQLNSNCHSVSIRVIY